MNECKMICEKQSIKKPIIITLSCRIIQSHASPGSSLFEMWKREMEKREQEMERRERELEEMELDKREEEMGAAAEASSGVADRPHRSTGVMTLNKSVLIYVYIKYIDPT